LPDEIAEREHGWVLEAPAARWHKPAVPARANEKEIGMEIIVAIVTLLLGLAVGAFLVWFSKEGQTNQAVAAAQAESLALNATLEEKVTALTQKEVQLSQDLASARHDFDQKRVKSEDEIYQLRQENKRLREDLMKSEGQLAVERQLGAERQQLLSQLEQRLAFAIGAASQQVLEAASERAAVSFSEKVIENSSHSFLEMAKSALDEFRPVVEELKSATAREATEAPSLEPAALAAHPTDEELTALIRPLDETLRKVEEQLREMERERSGDYKSLLERVQELGETQTALRAEAGRLASALRTPVQRGLWGEIQLRRVVEMAGMLEHCEFRPAENRALTMDETAEIPVAGASSNGHGPTPEASALADVQVRLPGARTVSIDARVPVEAYLAAVSADTEVERETGMLRHTDALRAYIDGLSDRLPQRTAVDDSAAAPDFVVAFLPGEAFLSAALAQDPGLLEYSIGKRVLLTTPTTLVSLLKTASYGWQQQDVAESARQMRELGQELFDRLRVLTGHFNGIKRGLETTLRAYNDAAGSMENRVLSTARKFKEVSGTNGHQMEAPRPVNLTPKEIHLPELRALVGAGANGDGD
jgi:DNA recombination protein RmuC